MSKVLTVAALALVLSTPAYAVDLGADVSADVAVPAVGASVKSSTVSESHEHTSTAPDGSVHSKENHSTSVRSSDRTHVGADADMTVDDEE